MKKTFLTFSTSDWTGTRTRLYFRALESGWFDNVVACDESVVPEELKGRLSEPFHGWYFWKPIAIYEQMKKMEYGDVLVYLDSGSDVNLAGYHYFDEHMRDLSDVDIMSYGYTYLRQFCNPKILLDFGISEDDARSIRVPQAGQLYIRKTERSMSIVKEWMDYMVANPDKIRMELDNAPGDIDGYVQNRCDQSVLGCIFHRNSDVSRLLKPNADWIVNCNFMDEPNVRSSECDFVPTRKRFDYRPYVMFAIGHELPFFEKSYDAYTHFVNVGNNNLHRMSDDTGDNIHELKDLAEMTGVYWIWKNVDLSFVKYIGITTHRKPFAMSNEHAFNALESGYDVVVDTYLQNRLESVKWSFGEPLVKEFLDTFNRFHPDLMDEFLKWESCGMIHPCNSFITSVSNFNALCEFVFPVMLDFARSHVGVSGRSAERISHAPASGVFCEDVTGFFIHKYLEKKVVSPIIIYPKGEEIFRAEVNPVGILQGIYKDRFFPNGIVPRIKNVIRAPTRCDSIGFYPNGSGPQRLPNVIQSKFIQINTGNK